MPEWEESWATAWLSYLAAVFFALPVLPKWVPLVVVCLAWLSGPVAYMRNGAGKEASGLVGVSVFLELAATGLVVLAYMGVVQLAQIHYLAAAVLMLTAGVAIFVAEGKQPKPEPRYGLEGLAMISFSCAYIVALMTSPSVRWLLALLMLHLGILAVAVVRNSHLQAERVEGPVVEGGYVKEVWRLRLRDPGGARAIFAALGAPSGLVGSVLVLAEISLLLVIRHIAT